MNDTILRPAPRGSLPCCDILRYVASYTLRMD